MVIYFSPIFNKKISWEIKSQNIRASPVASSAFLFTSSYFNQNREKLKECSKDIDLWSIFMEKKINFLTDFYISRKSYNKTFIKYFISIFPKGTC